MDFRKKGPAPINKERIAALMSRAEVRACIQLMAREACDRLGGFAEIGEGFIIIDTKKYTTIPAVKVQVCEPIDPNKVVLPVETEAKPFVKPRIVKSRKTKAV